MKKLTDTETTIFVYDAGGKLVAEYSTAAPPATPQVSYTTTDHLGSPRILTDQTGAVISRRDFLPFGQEINPGIGSRSSALNYGTTDTVRQKFTGYEGDTETDLDFAQARMYANHLGRFTSPDPIFLDSKRLKDPQLLTLYQYTRNSPLVYIDPSGESVKVKGSQQSQYLADLQEGLSFTVQIQKKKLVIVDANGKALDDKALKAMRESLTDAEKAIFDAITDKKHTATIDTGNGKANPGILFGKFLGNGKNKLDYADINLLRSEGNKGGLTPSTDVKHETIEAYASALGKDGPASHAYANGVGFGGLTPVSATPLANSDGKFDRVEITFDVVNQPDVKERVVMQLVKPISDKQKINLSKANVTLVEKIK